MVSNMFLCSSLFGDLRSILTCAYFSDGLKLNHQLGKAPKKNRGEFWVHFDGFTGCFGEEDCALAMSLGQREKTQDGPKKHRTSYK